jgi:hypothetical protein
MSQPHPEGSKERADERGDGEEVTASMVVYNPDGSIKFKGKYLQDLTDEQIDHLTGHETDMGVATGPRPSPQE